MKDYIEQFISDNPDKKLAEWTELENEPTLTKHQEELLQNLDEYKNFMSQNTRFRLYSQISENLFFVD
jgi:hypothetical protein